MLAAGLAVAAAFVLDRAALGRGRTRRSLWVAGLLLGLALLAKGPGPPRPAPAGPPPARGWRDPASAPALRLARPLVVLAVALARRRALVRAGRPRTPAGTTGARCSSTRRADRSRAGPRTSSRSPTTSPASSTAGAPWTPLYLADPVPARPAVACSGPPARSSPRAGSTLVVFSLVPTKHLRYVVRCLRAPCRRGRLAGRPLPRAARRGTAVAGGARRDRRPAGPRRAWRVSSRAADRGSSPRSLVALLLLAGVALASGLGGARLPAPPCRRLVGAVLVALAPAPPRLLDRAGPPPDPPARRLRPRRGRGRWPPGRTRRSTRRPLGPRTRVSRRARGPPRAEARPTCRPRARIQRSSCSWRPRGAGRSRRPAAPRARVLLAQPSRRRLAQGGAAPVRPR